jgi:hypothetical protein
MLYTLALIAITLVIVLWTIGLLFTLAHLRRDARDAQELRAHLREVARRAQWRNLQ